MKNLFKNFLRSVLLITLALNFHTTFAGEIKYVVDGVEKTLSSDAFNSSINSSSELRQEMMKATSEVLTGSWTPTQVVNALICNDDGNHKAEQVLVTSIDMSDVTITGPVSLSLTNGWDGPFYSRPNLKKVILPNSGFVCTNLREAFRNCKKLTTVENFDKITGTDVSMYWCFYGCSVLESIVMPQHNFSLSTLERAFYNCFALTSLTFPAEAFTCPEMTKMCWQCTALTSVNLENLTGNNIALVSTFEGCSSLEEVTMPKASFTSSDLSRCFSLCKKLVTVNNFENLESNDITKGTSLASTFYGCEALEYVNMPVNNFVIASLYRTFWQCLSLPKVDMSGFSFSTIGVPMAECFNSCSRLTEVIFPETGFMLGQTSSYSALKNTFTRCVHLVKLTNFDKLQVAEETTIRMDGCFESCYYLTQVEFGFNPTQILEAQNAFGRYKYTSDTSTDSNKDNIVKVFPEGTTQADYDNSSTVKSYFGPNVCAKTGADKAILLSPTFMFVRNVISDVNNGAGIEKEFKARYYCTYDIDLNGKQAKYVDNKPYPMWNTFMCPFKPDKVLVNYREVQVKSLLKDFASGCIQVASFLWLYDKPNGDDSQLSSLFLVKDQMQANVPYMFHAYNSGVVQFVCDEATGTVAKTETEFTTAVKIDDSSEARQHRIASTGRTAVMGGHIGSYYLKDGAAYLNETGTAFKVYGEGKWSNDLLGSNYMLNGDMYITEIIPEGADDEEEVDITIWDMVIAGLDGVAASNVKVSTTAGAILVDSADAVKTTVYGVNGAVLYEGTDSTIPMSQGYYLVVAGGKAHKVMVK